MSEAFSAPGLSATPVHRRSEQEAKALQGMRRSRNRNPIARATLSLCGPRCRAPRCRGCPLTATQWPPVTSAPLWPNAPDQAPQRAKRAAVACFRKFDGRMTRSRFAVTAASSPERDEDLERRWSDDLPTMAQAQFGSLELFHRGEGAVRPLQLLQIPDIPDRMM